MGWFDLQLLRDATGLIVKQMGTNNTRTNDLRESRSTGHYSTYMADILGGRDVHKTKNRVGNKIQKESYWDASFRDGWFGYVTIQDFLLVFSITVEPHTGKVFVCWGNFFINHGRKKVMGSE
jgi:hypothetical protein